MPNATHIEIEPILPDDATNTLALVIALEEHDAELEERAPKKHTILDAVSAADYKGWIEGDGDGVLQGYKVVTDTDPYAGHVIFSPDTSQHFYSWTGFSEASAKASEYGVYLDELYIKPELRGKSLGSQLVARVAFEALRQEVGLWLQVMGPNQPARDFYASIGGKEHATPPTSYGVERFIVTFNDLAMTSMCVREGLVQTSL